MNYNQISKIGFISMIYRGIPSSRILDERFFQEKHFFLAQYFTNFQ